MLAQPKTGGTQKGFNYHEEENYYQVGQESGQFYGKLAEELGFTQLDRESLLNALEGNNAAGEKMVKTRSDGIDENGYRKNAYTDLTFTIDKSLSVAYENAIKNDAALAQKIAACHQSAVRRTLDYVEKEYIYSRKETKAQDKALFMIYDHHESRMVDNKIDPSLHSHALLVGITQNENGTYNKLDNSHIMLDHQMIGLLYRNEVALLLQKEGIEIEVHDAKQGFYQTKGFSKEAREEFSQRSQQISKWVKENEARIKETYPNITNKQLRDLGQKATRGFKDKELDLTEHKNQNLTRAADLDYQLPTHNNEFVQKLTAEEIINKAIYDISDFHSVWAKKTLLEHASKISMGTIGLTDMLSAIENNKEMLHTLHMGKTVFTVQEILDKEQFVFSSAKDKSFLIESDNKIIEKAIDDFEKRKGFALKDGQREMVQAISAEDQRVIVTQGVAGSGKSTALEIVKDLAVKNNIKLVAIAPTGVATDNLAKEAGIEQSMTVARFILEGGKNLENSIVIVDESGMLGLRDTEKIIQIAQEKNIKLILSGDKNQKKSIQQGDIFKALQDTTHGFRVVDLKEGNRQKTDELKAAVNHILNREIDKGIEVLKDTTHEIKDPKSRLKAAAEKYLEDRHNSLLIATTNKDRQELNSIIREHLVKTGEVKDSKMFQLRDTSNLTNIEKRYSNYYQPNQSVYLSKNIGSISAGREAVITGINHDNNTLTLSHTTPKGKEINETVNLSNFGEHLNIYKAENRELGVGDEIIFKKVDKKFKVNNGEVATITKIEGTTITADIMKDDKVFKTVEIDTSKYGYIQHGYAITDFAAQGKSINKLIAVANSLASSFNDFYTQITRAKYEVHIITDDLEHLKTRAAEDSIKLNASDLSFTQNQTQTKETTEMKLSQEEFKTLSQQTKDELKLTDVAPVLSALGIEYKVKANGRYEFKARSGEKTASANMYIDKSGEWKYKDFGSGVNGTIENLIMDTTGVSYKEALDYALMHSNVRDYAAERLDELRGVKTVAQEKPNLTLKKQENLKKVENQVNSRVTEIKEIGNYKPAIDYLASRGIHKIPSQFKMITGEYTNKDGEVKKAFGVGIESVGGADVHFIKQIGSLKTMNFGSKGISLFQSQEPTRTAVVFESKMDYASAAQQRDFKDVDIIIANSTSNAHKVAEAIKNNYENVKFYQQNDKAGIQFVKDVSKEAELAKFEYVRYLKSEKDQDINDLIKNNVKLEERNAQSKEQVHQEPEKSFVEQVKDAYETVSDLIDLVEKENNLESGGFFKDLENIPQTDISDTFEVLDHVIKQDSAITAKQMVKAAISAVKDVVKEGNISLSGVTKSIVQSLRTQNLGKSIEQEM